MPEKLLICGFMGSGKSTLLRAATKWLPDPYETFDLDDLILSELQLPSVAQIFDQFGEEYFRKIEQNCLKTKIAQSEVFLGALGGGSLSTENYKIIKDSNAVLVWVELSFEEIWDRIKESSRPLVAKAHSLSSLCLGGQTPNVPVSTHA